MIGAQWADQSAPPAADSPLFSGNKTQFFTTIMTVWPTTEGALLMLRYYLGRIILFLIQFSAEGESHKLHATSGPVQWKSNRFERKTVETPNPWSLPSIQPLCFLWPQIGWTLIHLHCSIRRQQLRRATRVQVNFPLIGQTFTCTLRLSLKFLFPGRWYLHLLPPSTHLSNNRPIISFGNSSRNKKILTSGKPGDFSIFFLFILFHMTSPS
jgi:hypothetical protein